MEVVELGWGERECPFNEGVMVEFFVDSRQKPQHFLMMIGHYTCRRKIYSRTKSSRTT